MITLTDLLIQQRNEQRVYFKNYLKYARKIKEEVFKNLGPTKIFLFGSILRKNEIPQDIDILIVSKVFTNTEKKAKMRAKIWKKIGIFSPFEVHFASPEEYDNWYKYFLKEKIEV